MFQGIGILSKGLQRASCPLTRKKAFWLLDIAPYRYLSSQSADISSKTKSANILRLRILT